MKKYFVMIFLLLFPVIAAYGQQFPPIGIIDFYGLRQVSVKNVQSMLKIKIGDDWIKTLNSVEENRRRLKTLPGIEDAAISLVCCDDSGKKSIIFVGIREKGSSALQFRAAPNGKTRLPQTIVQAGKDFQAAFARAIAEKDFSEDDSQGYALAGNQKVKKIQERFIPLAAKSLSIIRRVLRESSDSGERALAAQIIAYVPNKNAVVGDLLYGVSDADEQVRNNATRALILIAHYSNANPRLKIKIPADDFVPMLNSLDWTDRNKSLGVLDALTRSRDTALLKTLDSAAPLASLVEMARWTNPGHAQPAFSILGRIGNFSEPEIEAMQKSPDISAQINKILSRIKRGSN